MAAEGEDDTKRTPLTSRGWSMFKRMTEEPVNHHGTLRVLAVLFYGGMTLVSFGFIYAVVAHNKQYTAAMFKTVHPIRQPDIVACPDMEQNRIRGLFALKNGHYVHKPWPYNVKAWMNHALIEELGISVEQVDEFFKLHKEDKLGTPNQKFDAHLKESFERIQKGNFTAGTLARFKGLFKYLKRKPEFKLVDLFAVIASSHYLKDEVRLSIKCRYGIPCDRTELVWVDDHLCVMFDHNRTINSNEQVWFTIGNVFLEDREFVKSWVGNLFFDEVRLDLFHTSSGYPNPNSWYSTGFSTIIRFTPYRIRGKLKETICQRHLTGIDRFEKCHKRILNDYWLFDLYATNGTQYYNVILWKKNGLSVLLDTYDAFSPMVIVEFASGILALFVGFSMMQVVQIISNIIKQRINTTAASRVISIVKAVTLTAASAVIVAFVAYDIINHINTRYVPQFKVTMISEQRSIEFPTVEMCSQGGSKLLNASVLRELEVTNPALQYLFLVSVGTFYSGIRQSKAWPPHNNSRHPSMYLRDKWTKELVHEFVALQTSDTQYMMDRAKSEYEGLAKKLNVDPEDTNEMLKRITLDKCKLFKSCKINSRLLKDCCKLFDDIFLKGRHCYALRSTNMKTNRIGELGGLQIELDVNALEQADTTPYLGKALQEFVANNTDSSELSQGVNNVVFYIMDEVFDMQPSQSRNVHFSELKHGTIAKMSIRATESVLLPQVHGPNSGDECMANPTISRHYHPRFIEQQMVYKQICGCYVCSVTEKNIMLLVLPKAPCCNREQTVRCLLDKRFYTKFCKEKRGKMWNKPLYQYPYRFQSKDGFGVYFFAHISSCNWEQFLTSKFSPTYGILNTTEIFEKSKLVRSCKKTSYVANNIELVENLNDPTSGFKIFIYFSDATVLTTEEEDKYEFLVVFSLVLSGFGLVIGISALEILEIVTAATSSIVRNQTVRQTFKNSLNILNQHWSRSVRSIASDNGSSKESTRVKVIRVAPAANNPPGQTATEGANERKQQRTDEAAAAAASIKSTVESSILLGLLFVGAVASLYFCVEFIRTDNYTTSDSSFYVERGMAHAIPSVAICQEGQVGFQKLKNLIDEAVCTHENEEKGCSEVFSTFVQLDYVPIRHSCVLADNGESRSLLNHKSADLTVAMKATENATLTTWMGDSNSIFEGVFNPAYKWATHSSMNLHYETLLKRLQTDCRKAHSVAECPRCESTSNQQRLCCFSDKQKSVPNVFQPKGEKPSCEQTFYMFTMTKEEASDEGAVQFSLSPKSDVVQLLEERYHHNFATIFAVLGGYVNMFLGISVLNVLFVLLLAVVASFARCGKKKPQQ